MWQSVKRMAKYAETKSGQLFHNKLKSQVSENVSRIRNLKAIKYDLSSSLEFCNC